MRRQLGVSYPKAWLINHRLMQVMADREDRYVLAGKVQLDDACLCGERTGDKVGRGSENKVPFVASVSLRGEWSVARTFDAHCRIREGGRFGMGKKHIAPGSAVSSDGLACFGAVT
jgi:hypothetical protein